MVPCILQHFWRVLADLLLLLHLLPRAGVPSSAERTRERRREPPLDLVAAGHHDVLELLHPQMEGRQRSGRLQRGRDSPQEDGSAAASRKDERSRTGRLQPRASEGFSQVFMKIAARPRDCPLACWLLFDGCCAIRFEFV